MRSGKEINEAIDRLRRCGECNPHHNDSSTARHMADALRWALGQPLSKEKYYYWHLPLVLMNQDEHYKT